MAENVSDILNRSLYGTSANVKDFRPALVANCVFNSFLSYTTIILNIVTIHAIRKTASLPKPLRTLLLSLAASDVGVGLLVQPLYISSLVSCLKRKRIDCISNEGVLAVVILFCASSVFNVVTISVDRFLAVHLHLRYQELVTHKRVIAAVISIWLLSAIISSSVFWDTYIISRVIWLVIMTVCLIVVVTVYWRIYIVLKRHKNQIRGLQIQEVQQGVQNGDVSNFLKLSQKKVSSWNILCMYFVLDMLFAFLYFLFFSRGPSFKSNLFKQSSALYKDFVFPQLVFEPSYILLEDETHSSHPHGHNARHRQSVQRITFVMRNCCCKYKLLETSRLLSHADMRT